MGAAQIQGRGIYQGVEFRGQNSHFILGGWGVLGFHIGIILTCKGWGGGAGLDVMGGGGCLRLGFLLNVVG